MNAYFCGLLTALVLLVACAEGGGNRPASDSGTSDDTGADVGPMDGNVPDTGSPDGSLPDTGVPDTGAPDSGTGTPDTSTPDTGTPDTGTPDTGTTDTGTPDTGAPDAGAPDTGTPDAGCTGAADCDDGLTCNGTERCELGACVSGTPPICDDGVACTVNQCVEPGTCTYTPDHGLCGAGFTCDMTAGCTATCSDTPCRLISPQCGCPTGQGCFLSGTTRACANLGTLAEGDPCSTATDCSAGTMCLNAGDSTTVFNICTRHCATDSDCATDSLCVYELNDGTGTPIPGVRLCSHACDIVRQTGCTAGTYCVGYRESTGAMRRFTDCSTPEGSGGRGATCVTNTDCQGGYACVDTGGTSDQCLHLCETATGVGCISGESCSSFSTPYILNGDEIGACL